MSKFSDEDITLAKKVYSTYGVPVSVTLGMYALESGYGKSTVGKNNYFNIKGNGQGGYRDYISKEESFMDFGKLLSNERYTSQTANANSIEEYVQGVKNGGYAEDNQYVSKVMSVIKSNNLTQYDNFYNGSSNSNSIGTSISFGKVDLVWWGEITRVIVILLVCLAGFVFLALSFNDMGLSVPNHINKLTKGVE